MIANRGNRELYEKQSINFDECDCQMAEVATLIKKYRKGLEQEVLIVT